MPPYIPPAHRKLDVVKNTNEQQIILDFPVKTHLFNFHLWLLFVADRAFVKNNLTPSFIARTDSAWSPYSKVLFYLYELVRYDHVKLKEVVAPVLKNLSESQLNAVLAYGHGLAENFMDACQKIDEDVQFFLAENHAKVLDKKLDSTFNEWYNSKFENTSSVHRSAYIYMARDKDVMSNICTMLLVSPPAPVVLAVKDPEKDKDHRHVWSWDTQSSRIKCYCGEMQSYEEMASYGVGLHQVPGLIY